MTGRRPEVDVAADAGVALYCSRVVPRLTLGDVAAIVGVPAAAVADAYRRRLAEAYEPPRREDSKRCPRCGQVLPLESFARNRAARDGRQVYCSPCRNGYRAERAEPATAGGAHA